MRSPKIESLRLGRQASGLKVERALPDKSTSGTIYSLPPSLSPSLTALDWSCFRGARLCMRIQCQVG
jgi:hypothetical protein